MKISNIHKPTSAKLHKIGMGIVAAGTSLAGTAYVNGHPILGAVIGVITAIGLFITNVWE